MTTLSCVNDEKAPGRRASTLSTAVTLCFLLTGVPAWPRQVPPRERGCASADAGARTGAALSVQSDGDGIAVPVLPAVSLQRMSATPDLMQASAALGLPWGGMAHCGPVSAADSILWLAGSKFDRLVQGDPRLPETSTKLVHCLSRYMHTSKLGGTDVAGFLRGLEDYVGDRGYKAKLRYQGWEEHPARFSAGKQTSIKFIKAGLQPNSAAWIKIGWYTFNPRTRKYSRFAGHWVAVVAAGVGRTGKASDSTVVIHDPAPRSGASTANEFCTVAPVLSGEVLTGYQKNAVQAAGFLKIGGELKIKERASCGLIDGAVVMENLGPQD